ncbi:pantoate--beta-alanine ligase [Arachidicoccus ginsenosidivorans]|uniref:Pantothenate synthetase n=1 Tax=Arachidicoccus ginsenosidivorans TaxID=496057 RepID=A0A5B8VJ47_9BACT|nr:pantoate--beta-alanine ligase [Arachidicoccus ginsenosidivorans]QEC71035.1 pantoate--beta-alanine ligase [Arachidicoccus ginsenosidivorans]
MIILKKVAALTKILLDNKVAGKSSAFVPTMGALHEGHLSLIRQAKQQADITICSIFVNPTQFNDSNDFNKYPVTTSQDISLLLTEQVDYLFMPTVTEMYPADLPKKNYDLGKIEAVLEGAHRPGHFQGVAQVIDRLVSLVQPDFMIMGQKDFQQVMVVERLLELIGSKTRLITSPTLRENSGLAKSSRNARLTELQKEQATAIYKSLLYAKAHIAELPIKEMESQVTGQLLQAGFDKVDYVAICHPKDLSPINIYTPGMEAVMLIAAFLGEVRLIDNMLV